MNVLVEEYLAKKEKERSDNNKRYRDAVLKASGIDVTRECTKWEYNNPQQEDIDKYTVFFNSVAKAAAHFARSVNLFLRFS